jgi:transcriptional regulator with XRE-family HTH domain
VREQTFGQILAEARQQAGLSQKQLAALIKKLDGRPISPQYLNDLEHDRRNPPSEYLIIQFAHALKLKKDYLMLAAGKISQDVRAIGVANPEMVERIFQLFRKARK